jgi:hypothetical protein
MKSISIEDIGFITGILGLLGILFTAYNRIRNPQITGEKRDALLKKEFQWSTEATERRFNQMDENFKLLLAQSNNHIHTVDTKVGVLTDCVGDLGKEIVKLTTIIDERVPKKTC